MKEKIIKICGKDVKLIYCAATENSFEDIAQKSIGVFVPKFEEQDGKIVIIEDAKCTIGDWVALGMAGIIAASARDGMPEPPVTFDEILFDAKPSERNALTAAIQALRYDWYGIPNVVEDLLNQDQKNAQANDEEGEKEETTKN